MYNLAGHVGSNNDEGAFRALSWGYTHWASGRIQEIDLNTNNPEFCHVRGRMQPSMKVGVYITYILQGGREKWRVFNRLHVNVLQGNSFCIF